MIIDKIGWYKTRAGALAYVGYIFPEYFKSDRCVAGYVGKLKRNWFTEGNLSVTGDANDDDLVEFIGPDKPKQKRMVEQTIDCFVNVYGASDRRPFKNNKYSIGELHLTESDAYLWDQYKKSISRAVPAKITFSMEEEVDENDL
jgi:hypothetical protein